MMRVWLCALVVYLCVESVSSWGDGDSVIVPARRMDDGDYLLPLLASYDGKTSTPVVRSNSSDDSEDDEWIVSQAYIFETGGDGACTFGDMDDSTLMLGGLSHWDWDDASHCGECLEAYSVYGNSVTVMISDKCDGCVAGEISLSVDAFDALAPIGPIKMDIGYKLVPCEKEGNIMLYTYQDMDPWWVAIQARNYQSPVARMTIRPDPDSQWYRMQRSDYNYFTTTLDTDTDGPALVRVYSNTGEYVEAYIHPLEPDMEVETNGQFAMNGSAIIAYELVMPDSSTALQPQFVVAVLLLFGWLLW